MDEIKPVWRESFPVRAYEAGPTGLASLPALCDWLQEAAGNHAHHLGWAIDTLQSGGLTWVLSRLHVAVARMPAWRECVTVETWPKGAARAFAVREFRVTDESGAVIVAATSGWLLLDLATRRPVRPPEAVAVLGGQTPQRILDDPFARLPELSTLPSGKADSPSSELSPPGSQQTPVLVKSSRAPFLESPRARVARRECDVRFADLDMNGHANNVAIIRLLLEGLPDAVLRERRPVALEIEFRAEAQRGERLGACSAAAPGEAADVAEVGCTVSQTGAPDEVFLHRLERRSDGREIARGRSTWRG